MSFRKPPILLVATLLLGCSTTSPQAAGRADAPEPSGRPAGRPATPTEGFGAPGAVDVREMLAEAGATISAEDAMRRLSILAHDSMMGRDTERPEIWTAARYIAGEFRAMGLEAMDEDGDFIDEYPILIPEIDVSQVRMVVEANGTRLDLVCGEDFAVSPAVSVPEFTGVVLAPQVAHDWYRANPAHIPPGSLVLATGFPLGTQDITEGLRFGSWMDNVREAGANAVGIILPPQIPLEAMSALAAQMASSPVLDRPPMLLMPRATVEKIFDLAGSPPPELDPLKAMQTAPANISLHMPTQIRTLMAPNVLARLRGAMGEELNEVVVSAHFDHEPPGPPTPEGDSIFNGADDNASGTVGLLEVAKAFATLPEPPVRTVVFAAVSAEEMGLLGSAYLAEHGPAPAGSVSAALNMDMLSRNGPDSLFVFGQTYSSLGTVLRTVLEDHPELGFQVRPGLQMPELDLIRYSDQFSYLARGVPVLMFNSGFHPELHTPDDEVEKADTDKLARAARLMFFLTYAVANDPEDPVWTEEGRIRTEAMQKVARR
jgi:hypothetical protein